jgi:hypothetical protein
MPHGVTGLERVKEERVLDYGVRREKVLRG